MTARSRGSSALVSWPPLVPRFVSYLISSAGGSGRSAAQPDQLRRPAEVQAHGVRREAGRKRGCNGVYSAVDSAERRSDRRDLKEQDGKAERHSERDRGLALRDRLPSLAQPRKQWP